MLAHGLKLLEEISGQMAGHHRFAAVQTHLYERAGGREGGDRRLQRRPTRDDERA